MAIVRWDPFREVNALEDRLNRMVHQFWTGQDNVLTGGNWVPPVDIYETADYGPFARSFTLPERVDTDRVSAEYRHGVLSVRLPLRAESKPRQIQVEVAA